MDEKKTRTWFTNRQFVAAIRAELDEAGHHDIAISRQWIEEEVPGYGYLVHVPVGSALTAPLKVMNSFFDAKDMDDLGRHAREFALALVNLKRAEKMLEKYARDVRTAAIAQVAAARAEGLDILLDDVGFKPTYAYHLTGKAWKEAVFHVLAAVTIRHTSFHLRPTTSELWVEEPADVAKEMEDIVQEQRERQARIAELDVPGADLIVDQITLDLLATHGVDAEEVLERVWKKQCVNLTVKHGEQDVSLSLISSEGIVTASIVLEDAIWNGEHLWFRGPEHLKDHKHLIGKSVGELVRHPVFAARPIVDVFNRHADHVVFDLSDKVMFDADTGRLWRDEKLAA
jgi:hypothetical protein